MEVEIKATQKYALFFFSSKKNGFTTFVVYETEFFLTDSVHISLKEAT